MSLSTSIGYWLASLFRIFAPGRLYKITNLIFSIFNVRYCDIAIYISGIYFIIDTNNYHERGLFLFGRYERGTTEFIRQFLGQLDSGIAIDVGANIGIHTLNMCAARRNNNIAVISIEPNLDMVERLESNIALNNFKNVHVSPYGVNDVESTLDLGLSYVQNNDKYHNPGLASMVQTSKSVRTIQVKCLPLDKIVKDLGMNIADVSLVKIDVEGKELDVLKGMAPILKSSSTVLIIEFNQDNFISIKEYLCNFGYKSHGSLLWYGIDNSRLAENILFMKSP